MTEFSDYIHELARGPNSRRDLDFDGAFDAMTQLLDGRTSREQAAAFLVALRIKGETTDEFAGCVDAARQQLPSLDSAPNTPIDINWPCYSGKSRQPLWFLLTAKLLADNGLRILLHDAPAASAQRGYARQQVAALGIPTATSLAEAAANIEQHNICWIGLESLSTPLVELLQLRQQLGVRSIVNSLVRCLSPLPARLNVQSVFHPHYLTLHASAAQQLGDSATLIFKGDGGEAEVRPYANSRLQLVTPAGTETVSLNKVCDKPAPQAPDTPSLLALWQGNPGFESGQAAVLNTSAALLWACGRHQDMPAARKQAGVYWRQRRLSHR